MPFLDFTPPCVLVIEKIRGHHHCQCTVQHFKKMFLLVLHECNKACSVVMFTKIFLSFLSSVEVLPVFIVTIHHYLSIYSRKKDESLVDFEHTCVVVFDVVDESSQSCWGFTLGRLNYEPPCKWRWGCSMKTWVHGLVGLCLCVVTVADLVFLKYICIMERFVLGVWVCLCQHPAWCTHCLHHKSHPSFSHDSGNTYAL